MITPYDYTMDDGCCIPSPASTFTAKTASSTSLLPLLMLWDENIAILCSTLSSLENRQIAPCLFHREWHVIRRMRRQYVPGPVFHRSEKLDLGTRLGYTVLMSRTCIRSFEHAHRHLTPFRERVWFNLGLLISLVADAPMFNRLYSNYALKVLHV